METPDRTVDAVEGQPKPEINVEAADAAEAQSTIDTAAAETSVKMDKQGTGFFTDLKNWLSGGMGEQFHDDMEAKKQRLGLKNALLAQGCKKLADAMDDGYISVKADKKGDAGLFLSTTKDGKDNLNVEFTNAPMVKIKDGREFVAELTERGLEYRELAIAASNPEKESEPVEVDKGPGIVDMFWGTIGEIRQNMNEGYDMIINDLVAKELAKTNAENQKMVVENILQRNGCDKLLAAYQSGQIEINISTKEITISTTEKGKQELGLNFANLPLLQNDNGQLVVAELTSQGNLAYRSDAFTRKEKSPMTASNPDESKTQVKPENVVIDNSPGIADMFWGTIAEIRDNMNKGYDMIIDDFLAQRVAKETAEHQHEIIYGVLERTGCDTLLASYKAKEVDIKIEGLKFVINTTEKGVQNGLEPIENASLFEKRGEQRLVAELFNGNLRFAGEHDLVAAMASNPAPEAVDTPRTIDTGAEDIGKAPDTTDTQGKESTIQRDADTEPAVSETAESKEKIHVVKEGDILYTKVQEYFPELNGEPSKIWNYLTKVSDANPGININLIFPGQKIKLPNPKLEA